MGGYGSGRLPKVKGGQSEKLRPPAGLVAEARPYFRRLVRVLEGHGLTAADSDALGQLATALLIADQAAATLARDGVLREDLGHGGQLVKHPALVVWRQAVTTATDLGKLFGTSPAARVRLGLDQPAEQMDPLDAFLAGAFEARRDPYNEFRLEREDV